MTIQRKYSSPSCQLVLQGLIDGKSNPSESRPCMSMLMDAECKFTDFTQSLTGGREFFESLVTQISRYTQTILSDVAVPESPANASSPVHLQRMGDNLHRLTVRLDPGESVEFATQGSPVTQLDLTTVQLFDLVETIDQFFADPRTLPSLTLDLQPIGKREVKPDQPLAQQAIPAAVGLASVALAAIAFLSLPVPEVKPPKDLLPQPQTEAQTEETLAETPGATPPPEGSTDGSALPPVAKSPQNLESTLAPGPVITDPALVKRLQAGLNEKLIQGWVVTPELSRSLMYRVSVAEDGDIVGYDSINDATTQEEKLIPLPQLLYRAPASSRIEEPLADFKVAFNPNGQVEVNPWTEEKN
ncbi:MAG: DUF4335 domain-containing protein [Microcoleaceae cyanobacterium]